MAGKRAHEQVVRRMLEEDGEAPLCLEHTWAEAGPLGLKLMQRGQGPDNAQRRLRLLRD